MSEPAIGASKSKVDQKSMKFLRQHIFTQPHCLALMVQYDSRTILIWPAGTHWFQF